MTKCADTEHDFEKFNESTVVCRKCADQRTVTTLEAIMDQLRSIHVCPTYIPCTLPHYPHQPYWQPTITTYTSSGTTTGEVLS
jgi:hypothetical protein